MTAAVTPEQEELARDLALAFHGDEVEWRGFLSKAALILSNKSARLAAKPADEGVRAWLREVDSGTDNACWIVCNRIDPGAVEFSPATGEPKR